MESVAIAGCVSFHVMVGSLFVAFGDLAVVDGADFRAVPAVTAALQFHHRHLGHFLP